MRRVLVIVVYIWCIFISCVYSFQLLPRSAPFLLNPLSLLLNDVDDINGRTPKEFSIGTAYDRFPPKEDADDERSVAEGGSVLGRGTFGTVYLMQHSIDKKLFAVKQVRLAVISDFVQIKNIEKETQILMELHHGNIVRYHTCFYSKNNR
jgi:Protein kinase domain